MGSSSTLDQLWNSLGLDSLPHDAGTAHGLDSTRARDFDGATFPSGDHAEPIEIERNDLPRLTIDPPIDAGERVHHDLIVTGVLGEGGMGKVLLAHQASLGRDVAVKIAKQNSQNALRALLHEAQTTGGLEHPGVIPVYSLASDGDGRPALVMKRVDGVSWSTLLRNSADAAWERIDTSGSERIDSNIEILRQVCNAIAFAHRRGVLHRDIKPSNVLIGEFGEVYVADWGIARRKPKPGENRKPGLVGSPVYLAPEMVTGEDSQMDERTDVFLLGATLFELLSGTPPWVGPDLRAVLALALECEPRGIPSDAPAELVSICRKAMAPQRSDRFQTVLEFREALSGFLLHRGSVRLARASRERLHTLLAMLQSTTPAAPYPLMSECRFGFTQALREWPENEDAREGLSTCLVAMAKYEIGEGNLIAARALVRELAIVPAEVTQALAELEQSAAESHRRQKRLEHLRQEMDPLVAMRQRVLAFSVSALAMAAMIALPYLFPQLRTALGGRWYLTSLSLAVNAVVLIGTLVGRKSLFSTRLNRRLISLLIIASFGTTFLRVVSASLDLSSRTTLLENFVLILGVCVTAAVMLHARIWWSAVVVGLGFVVAIFAPGFEGPAFSTSAVLATAAVIVSWRSWSNELR